MTDITITINGKTHQFAADDQQAMADMAWQDRKQLIDLLETIKQAEYVKKQAVEAHPKPVVQDAAFKPEKPVKPEITQPFDGTSKMGQGDVDLMMSRLIMEDKKNQTRIPDRGVVLKWMLIGLAAILLMMLLF